ncbi:MAG TPA: CaiB/BaiF CoA-transferase family protein [Ktedonobacterales bacterium]
MSDTTSAPSGPLSGLRVLDLTRLLPGPFAGQMLTELGAETLKIEEPGVGDGARMHPPLINGVGQLFLATNRGKRSAALNLKSPGGREALLRLVDHADILLEGFRPGVMARLDLSFETLLARNPRLIICSITGYGQDGPYNQRAGHDLNYIGFSGVLAHLTRRGEMPPLPGAQFADIVSGALMAVIGTLSALVARGVTGRGQIVDVSMLDGSFALVPVMISTLLSGFGEPIPGEGILTGALPSYGIYETSDGRYVTLGALEPKFWEEFCRRVGRADLAPRHTPRDAADRDEVVGEVAAIFRTRTRDEWLALLADADACFGPLNTMTEALDDPQVRARGVIMASKDGMEPMLRSVPLLSETPARLLGGAPALGAHTAEALAEVGYSAGEIATLRASGAIATHDAPGATTPA